MKNEYRAMRLSYVGGFISSSSGMNRLVLLSNWLCDVGLLTELGLFAWLSNIYM